MTQVITGFQCKWVWFSSVKIPGDVLVLPLVFRMCRWTAERLLGPISLDHSGGSLLSREDRMVGKKELPYVGIFVDIHCRGQTSTGTRTTGVVPGSSYTGVGWVLLVPVCKDDGIFVDKRRQIRRNFSPKLGL